MEYVLQTKALIKNYKDYKALNSLTMKVPKGSIYGLIGKNGAGKTTLIRLISGLQKPTNGDYLIYGTNSAQKEIFKVRRRIGAIIESPSIYLDLSAKDNLKEQCQILGLPSYENINKILKLVGLEDTGHKKAKDFSLGMKQRLAIGIAMIGDPDFLILDEPINGLDPQGIIEIRELILKLNREYNITILVASHYLDELARIATHYGFIDKGTMVKEISAEELELLFRKCVFIKVSDINSLSCILDDSKIEYKITSKYEAEIYGNIDIQNLILKLTEKQCKVESIHVKDESLENYYINLVGGNSHE